MNIRGSWRVRGVALVWMALPFFGLVSCQDRGLKPDSLGAVAEILLDCRPEEWQGESGRRLRQVLSAEQYGLPQPEPWFRLLPTQDLGANKFKDRHRFILRLRSESQSSLPDELQAASKKALALQGIYVGVLHHPRAFPQAEVWLVYRDTATLQVYLNNQGLSLLQQCLRLDQRLILDRLARYHRSDTLIRLIKDSVGVQLKVLPGDYRLRALRQNWAWLSRDIPNGTMNWCLWRSVAAAQSPLVGLAYRDTIFRNRLPGPTAGSYYQTETLVPTQEQRGPLFPSSKMDAWVVRGLWTLKGDFMGGPFVHHSRVDGLDRIHSEVFVYCPNETKRAWLRELEAMSLVGIDSLFWKPTPVNHDAAR
ncbi:MAG: DUF4837 family protein [Bacteroidota bacterium]